MASRRPGLIALITVLLLIEVTLVGDTTTFVASAPAGPATGPLRVSSQNSRYFATPDGTRSVVRA